MLNYVVVIEELPEGGIRVSDHAVMEDVNRDEFGDDVYDNGVNGLCTKLTKRLKSLFPTEKRALKPNEEVRNFPQPVDKG